MSSESIDKRMELSKQLEQYGLEDKKAEVYLACLELGPSPVQSIAQKTGIKRTSVYDIINSLTSQGLITQTVKGKKRLFVAEDPKTIKDLLQKKEREFDQILPELKTLHFVPGTKPKIKYYEGVEGAKRVLEDTLTSKEKILKSIIPFKDIIDLVGEDYFGDYTNRRIKSGYYLISVRPTIKEVISIREKHKWVTNKAQRREVRYAPKDFAFSMTMYLYDHKVMLISSKKENFGMIIESEEFTYNQKALFEVLWKISKP